MDVPMPAGSGNGVRAGGVSWRTWVEEHRRPVIIGAFAAAALLGILIGLLTAPSSGSPATNDVADVAAQRAPALLALPWATRSPNTPFNMKAGIDPNLRPALQWAAADAALAAAGKTTLSAAVAASSSPSPGGTAVSAAALTADEITIPSGSLYYGAIEGSSAANDVFWAVGLTQTSNKAVPLPGLEVWKRIGDGPWTVVASGKGACENAPVPTSLYVTGVWGGQPPPCRTQG